MVGTVAALVGSAEMTMVPAPVVVVLRETSVLPSIVDATAPCAVSIAVTAPIAPLSTTPRGEVDVENGAGCLNLEHRTVFNL